MNIKKPKMYAAWLIAILTIVLITAVYFGFLRLSSLVPGPEGVRALNYGYQFGAHGDILRASELSEMPDGFEWSSTQPSVMSLRHNKESGEPSGGYFVCTPAWWYDHGSGQVTTEVQRPMLYDDPVRMGASEITYHKYVQISETQVKITKFIVHIIPADFIIQLYSVPKQGIYTFKDIRNWFALDTVTWINAYSSNPPVDPDPLTNSTVKYLSSNYRGAYPIISWIGEYKDWVWKDDKGNYKTNPPNDAAIGHCVLDPSLEGRFIDLYTDASKTYDLQLNVQTIQDPDLLAQALQPNLLPDPRFAETVFFYIQMNSFGAYVKNTGTHYSSYTVYSPAVFYRLRVVYAVCGEYVYLWTKDSAEDVGYEEDTWETRDTKTETHVGWVDQILWRLADFFTSPWGIMFLILTLFIIFIIFLAYIGALPAVIAWISGRKRRVQPP